MTALGRRTLVLMAGAAALALGAPSIASATTMLRLTPEDLARASDLVAEVEVVSETVVAGDGVVETRTQVRVIRPIHGAPKGSVVTVVTPGGEHDGVTQRVAGAARPRVGESALVFLERAGGGRYAFVGMEQGYLRIVETGDGTVIERTEDARYVIHDGAGSVVDATPPPRREPLIPFVERVRLALESK